MSKWLKFKTILLLIITCCFLNYSSKAQTIVKYYDSIWYNSTKDSSMYFTEFVKEGDVYRTTIYWTTSKKIFTKSAFADTLFKNQVGLLLRYYESGQLQDSSMVSENGEIENIYHFYPNGKLAAHAITNKKTHQQKAEGYDEKGNLIEDFIFSREAAYPDGEKEWVKFLGDNVNTALPIKNHATIGTYRVIIRFVVDTNGKLVDVLPETHMGFGMEEEVIRVIKKSTRWIPAIKYGKPVNAYRKQPLTFKIDG